MTEYAYNAHTRVWQRTSFGGIGYSDGEDKEAKLLAALKQCSDVSCASPELHAHITDWPSEYHLSPVRHNLLRPFLFKFTDRILELGCGCGAITRYLGETGATIVSVEGSHRRAEIAAERCRDLPNVSIYCDNLAGFVSDEKFDYVTLIGVLEYAPKFIESDDPVRSCLEHARSFLKDDGILILAIENQLGLKYFNGCSEDHNGISYFGINNLYGKSDPATFGRYVLAERLRTLGFPTLEFFFPFPDYKLPGLILSEAALLDERLNIPDLLIHNTGRDYPERHYRAFAEDLAWRVVLNNRLLADFTNSFLVLARPGMVAQPLTRWLAKMFSRGQRNSCYQVESTIEADKYSGLVVRKRGTFPEAQATDEWLHHIVSDSSYLAGNLLVGKIHKAMAREARLEELAAYFAPWLTFLLAHAWRNETGEQVLPGSFVDCIPANLIENLEGELHYFDAEWVSVEPIPIAWTIVRGATYSLIDCLENRALKHLTYRQFITRIAQEVGVQLLDSDFVTADLCEARLVAQCYADASGKPRLVDLFDEPLYLVLRLSDNVPQLRQALAWHEAELARVKSSVSWRITAPFRVAWNLYLRMAGKGAK